MNVPEFETYVVAGMARAIWVHAYMVWATEIDLVGVPVAETWEEIAPDNLSTRAASHKAAMALRQVLGPQIGGRHPLGAMFVHSVQLSRGAPAGAPADAQPGSEATEADLAYAFGESVALVALGALDPEDAVLPLPDLAIPHLHVELEDGNELVWDVNSEAERPGERINPPDWPGSKIQSLLFDRDRFSLARAQAWARSHGYKATQVDTRERYHHIRQFDPIQGMPCRTIPLRDGVKAIVCATRNPGEGPEVLLIEDDPQLQRATTRVLKKIFPGAEVLIADNYDGAIGYLKTHPIAHVISDVNILGSLTGVDVFEWVRANKPDLVDRYVFFTGGNPQVAQIHYRFVEKPAGVAELRAEIEKPGPARARTTTPPPVASRTTTAPMAMDARSVAEAVHGVMPKIRETTGASGRHAGRFGDDKVFIAALWRELERDPRFAGMTLPQFKRRLIEANRDRYLDLARADLVGAMDPGELEASEIRDLGASFHFVVDRHAHAGAAKARGW